MEIIQLPGYTEWEKLSIAERYLIPKAKEANGVTDVEVEFGEESIRHIVHHYTKEAGVRNLERELSTIFRKIAKEVVRRGKDGTRFRVTTKNIAKYLGAQKYRYSKKEEQDDIGLTNGLAVTMYGGDLLATEVSVMPGKGKLVLTGKLGDVMQESAQAAMSYVRSRADSLGLEREFYQKVDIHVHFPEGAIPKDGPSAGITMATSLVSALLRVAVRRDVAMTGEITLRGRVLPIGGLKDKILAAHRSDIFTVVIPKENKKDLKDIPKRVLKVMKIHAVEHMDEVLRIALAHIEPEKFLPTASEAVDWRTEQPKLPPRAERTPVRPVAAETSTATVPGAEDAPAVPATPPGNPAPMQSKT
jgi:ATP-dependent Lon protease